MGAFKIADERALQDKEAVQEIKRQQRAKQAEMDKREASAKARGRARTPKEEVEWALEKSGKKEYSRDSHKSVATAASGGKGSKFRGAYNVEVTPMLLASPASKVRM